VRLWDDAEEPFSTLTKEGSTITLTILKTDPRSGSYGPRICSFKYTVAPTPTHTPAAAPPTARPPRDWQLIGTLRNCADEAVHATSVPAPGNTPGPRVSNVVFVAKLSEHCSTL
jgi:hypothetical protein